MSCVGCKCDGKPKTEEPCCRCDTERERKARLMDDPVLGILHYAVMDAANNWAGINDSDWYRGQVAGAMTAWHMVALTMPEANLELVRQAIHEYAGMVWGEVQ